MLQSAIELGLGNAETVVSLMRAIDSHRARMLDILGAPKRPGRPMVDERTVRMIREALPEEILVAEPSEPGQPPSPPISGQ